MSRPTRLEVEVDRCEYETRKAMLFGELAGIHIPHAVACETVVTQETVDEELGIVYAVIEHLDDVADVDGVPYCSAWTVHLRS